MTTKSSSPPAAATADGPLVIIGIDWADQQLLSLIHI